MNLIQRVIQSIIAPYRPNKSRTVRFAFPLLFVAAALMGANVIDSENQSFIHIETSDTSVREGDFFQIDVYISAHTPVNAVDVVLDFPKDQVDITGIDVGESVITLWTTEPYIENNTVVLRGGTFRRGFLGDHLIATINAQAKTSGLATFEVSDIMLLAGDGTGSEVSVSESGEESTQLLIASEDGTFVTANTDGSGIEGDITLRIVTDIDGDGTVSLADISRFMGAWSSKTEVFDFSGDGRMTFRDFAIILADSFAN
jgi:hypothetical protein